MNNTNTTNTVTGEYDYRKFMVNDDDDSYDDEDDDYYISSGVIDTSWITEYETKMMNDDYQPFLKSDITHVTFEFYYLDRDKMYVERIVPMTYSLRNINKITQNEIFTIIRSRQLVDKKYYNFQSLLLYSFDFQDNCKDTIRSLSNYISGSNNNDKSFIEYTNLLSIDIIYFPPLITMFHEFLGFSVLLYED